MLTRRSFLGSVLCLVGTAIIKSKPSFFFFGQHYKYQYRLIPIAQLQELMDQYVAPKMEDDVKFFSPTCERFRVTLSPNPCGPGYLAKATWIHHGIATAYCAGSVDINTYRPAWDNIGIVDTLRHRLTVQSIKFMERWPYELLPKT